MDGQSRRPAIRSVATRRRFALAVGVLVVAALPALGVIESCRSSHASCAVCGRDECRALAFRVQYTDGLVQETCCARCASHAVLEEKERSVATLQATDFASGKRLDARRAAYVEGSDYEHCSAPKAERPSTGCCMRLDYDRCQPSLVAFESEGAARKFIAEHGGSLRRFEDLRFGEPARAGGGR